MLKRLRDKLSYANVVASLALFIALGGSAYAIGAGTIGTREVRDNSLRSRDVRTNTLTGRDIDERTLRGVPQVYSRSSLTPITLSPAGSSQSVSCKRGDIAVSGKESATGDQFSFSTAGNLQGPSTYAASVFGAPGATGQSRTFAVSVVCLAHAPR